jgi:hypothetical protein
VTVTRISDEEFDDLLRSFEHSAFRLETRDAYAIGFEREEYDRFLAGSPRPPSEISWWQEWLDQTARLAREGKTVSRVRVLAEPPSDYQRWMIWARPWYAQAGEQITYLTHREARSLGLPDQDWWLLDGERALTMAFDDAGRVTVRWLVTDPERIAQYIKWRDLAVRNATPAERFAAA